MNKEIILKIIESSLDEIKFSDPNHETQFAYNEGADDVAIKIEEKLIMKKYYIIKFLTKGDSDVKESKIQEETIEGAIQLFTSVNPDVTKISIEEL